MELFFNAFIVGLGLVFGVAGAFGVLGSVYKVAKKLLYTFFPSMFSKWKFGVKYNDYQEVDINGTEWVNLPCPIEQTSILRQNGGKRAILISGHDEYNGVADLLSKEATKQTKTHEVV